MDRSSGLRAYDKTKLGQKAMNFDFRSHLSSQAIARIINLSWNNLPILAFYRRIIEWNKIFMAILQKQKEMFHWSNVNIRQKCWRLIKAKLLSFSNNADTETEVFHWYKTKTKCQISVPGERKKTDRLQISKTIIPHKSLLYCYHFSERQVLLCKAQNSFDGWKNQELENSPIFRYSSHFTSNQHHFALNLDFHSVFVWGKVWSFVFSQPEKG